LLLIFVKVFEQFDKVGVLVDSDLFKKSRVDKQRCI